MVKEIQLTHGYVALVDDENYLELIKHKWHIFNDHYTTYAVCRIGSRSSVRMHQLLLNFPKLGIDHVNGDGLDNRRCNLRLATQSQNLMNARKRLNTTSRYKGVTWKKLKKKWVASITINGKGKYLGIFIDEDDAARAYNEAAAKYFGEYARLNEIKELI